MPSKKTKQTPEYGNIEYPKTLDDHPFYGLRLNDEQKTFRDAIWSEDKLIVFCNAKSGTGKAQPNDTNIPTPDGYKMLGDIHIGDYVFDRNGSPTRVLGVFPQGKQKAYRVTLNDGRSTICCGEHLWTYYGYNSNIITETLNSMMRRSTRIGDNNGCRYMIPNNKCVSYAEASLPVHPYVVGAFIGNGCCLSRILTLSSQDEEVVSKVSTLLGANGYRRNINNYNWTFEASEEQKSAMISELDANKSITYIKTSYIFGGFPEITCKSYDKRIPSMYLISSEEQRMELLRGMLDTDGCICHVEDEYSDHYSITYSTVSRGLAYDVVSLVNSLGYKCKVKEDHRDKYTCGVCYNLRLLIPRSDMHRFFSLSRKLDKAILCKDHVSTHKYDRVGIASIEDAGYECDMTCLYVDNPEHLYLTNDYIVTHNTVIAVMTANLLCKYKRYEGIVYITAPVQEARIGFLPGTAQEKTSIYSEPFYQAAIKADINIYTDINQESMISQKNGTAYIDCIPHTFLRGLTFENKVVIIDECQNMYTDELRKTLTRMSDSCKVIVIGHTGQIDLYHNPQNSGFSKYLNHFATEPYAQICTLTENYRGKISTHADEI